MLGADTRGQAVQIGAVILFSFVVLTFSLYQATVVPDQNAEVEFTHNQQVQQDMVDVRSTVVAASFPGQSGVASVTLGTSYPPRAIAVNPGAASGSLRTQLDATIRIDSTGPEFTPNDDDVCGTEPEDDVSRTLVYEPNYNEFDAPRTVYENSVAFNQDTRDGGEAVLTGQALYYDTGSDDGALNLIALQNEFQRSSSQRVSVEFVHGETKRTVGVTDPEITLPTLVSNVETWERGVLGTVPSARVGSVTLDDANDEVTIQFRGTFDVLCTPVGVGGAPPSGTPNLAASGGSGGGGGGDTPPTASIDSVSDASQCGEFAGGGRCKTDPGTTNFAELEVDWSASDDNGIGDVTVELVDSTGTVVDTATPPASGTSDSGSVTLSEPDGYGEQYTIRVTVVDSSSQSDTTSRTETADNR